MKQATGHGAAPTRSSWSPCGDSAGELLRKWNVRLKKADWSGIQVRSQSPILVVSPGRGDLECGRRKGRAQEQRKVAGPPRGPQVWDAALIPARPPTPAAAWRCCLRLGPGSWGGTRAGVAEPWLCRAAVAPVLSPAFTPHPPTAWPTAPPRPGHRKHHPSLPTPQLPRTRATSPQPARKGSECTGFLWSPPGCQGLSLATALPLAPGGRPVTPSHPARALQGRPRVLGSSRIARA